VQGRITVHLRVHNRLAEHRDGARESAYARYLSVRTSEKLAREACANLNLIGEIMQNAKSFREAWAIHAMLESEFANTAIRFRDLWDLYVNWEKARWDE
jgi:hypothetical protein